MPVVINEFEVVVEPPRHTGSQARESQAASGQRQPLRPDEIDRIVRYFQQRRARVHAD